MATRQFNQSQLHPTTPLSSGPGIAIPLKVGIAATAAAEVTLLTDLIKRRLVIFIRELQVCEHPPTHIVDAKPVHALKSLVALPRLEITEGSVGDERHVAQVAAAQVTHPSLARHVSIHTLNDVV